VAAVFLFGPWSALSQGTILQGNEADTLRKFTSVAKSVIQGIDASTSPELSQALIKQLTTLTIQIATARRIVSLHKLQPTAVVGYSFGEYAAAVVSGALEEDEAVKILAARDYAVRDVEGAMLNVFCDAQTATSILSRMANPPSVAIKAGPQHTVLSGPKDAILAADKDFRLLSIKCHALMDATPFHSTIMKVPARLIAEVTVVPHLTDIQFVSGLAGTTLAGDRLGLRYWQRHMVGSIDFYKALNYIRETFPGSRLIDIGPNASLSKIISRYGWTDMTVVSAEDKEAFSASASVLPIENGHTFQSDASTEPSSLEVSTPDTGPSSDDNRVTVAKSLLHELFGYSEATLDQDLHQSLQILGLQSMDFIFFSEEFNSRTGLTLPLSAYTSDDSLYDILTAATPA